MVFIDGMFSLSVVNWQFGNSYFYYYYYYSIKEYAAKLKRFCLQVKFRTVINFQRFSALANSWFLLMCQKENHYNKYPFFSE